MKVCAPLFAMMFLASSALGQVNHIQAPGTAPAGPYTDIGSGVTFPPAIGAFQRFRLTPTPGGGVSGGYAYVTQSMRMGATVFVDRPPGGPEEDRCQRVVDAAKVAQQRQAPDAMFERFDPPARAGYHAVGARFRFKPENAYTGVRELYFYCSIGTPWVVEFSFFHAPAFDATPLEMEFLAGMPLPEMRP